MSEKRAITQSPPSKQSDTIARLQAFQSHPEWQLLMRIMRENVAFLEGQILAKKSPTGARLTEEQCDELRARRDAQAELVKLPQKIIAQLVRGEAEEEDLDPYYKDVNEIEP